MSEKLGIELIHIDRVYWKPGWVEPSNGDWLARLAVILERDRWIIDGNYSATLEMRLEAGDTAIFLDIRRTLCTWRVIRRTFRYWRRTRPDMAEGCFERLDLPFLAFVWNYPTRSRPKIMRLLKLAEPSTQIIHLRSPREVRRFISSMQKGSDAVGSFPLAVATE